MKSAGTTPMRRACWVIALLMGAIGCGGEGGDGDASAADGGADAGVPPDAQVDASLALDAAMFADASVEDAGLLDAGLLDAALLDAALLDSGLDSGLLLDAGVLDAGTLDAGALDAATPFDAGADAGASLVAHVRIHLFSSSVEDLDAAGIYTPAALAVFMTDINDTFAQAGVRWEIESIRTQPALDEAAYTAAVAAGTTGAGPLNMNIDPAEMLAPAGFDVFVVRRTDRLGFGGVYACAAGGRGRGAVYVPLLAGSGAPQQPRKWTHELGHATGLQHPACDPLYANNLMMSGTCSYAVSTRGDLAPGQVTRIRDQVMAGGPAVCGTLVTGF